jgi:hypothetical protein
VVVVIVLVVVVIITIAAAAAAIMIVTLDKAEIIKCLFLQIRGRGRRDTVGGEGMVREGILYR